MNMTIHWVKAALAVSLIGVSLTANASVVNFTNGWSESGGTFNWVVAPDGLSVEQVNGSGVSFFVSPDSYINKTFTGSYRVNTTSDDDWMSLAFGYNGLSDYYLLDWKQSNQSAALEGFSLLKVTAEIHSDGTLFNRTGIGYSTLATDYGIGRGWADNTTYDFTLTYTDSGINFSIDGGSFVDEEIFNLSGMANSAGRFGFHSYSQANTQFSNLEVIPEPATLGLMGLSTLGLFFHRRRGFRFKFRGVNRRSSSNFAVIKKAEAPAGYVNTIKPRISKREVAKAQWLNY